MLMLSRTDTTRRRDRERQRRRYARLKACRGSVTVEYNAALIDLLVRTEWLSEARSHDRDAIREAIEGLLASLPKHFLTA
jgi:hypothetical protein